MSELFEKPAVAEYPDFKFVAGHEMPYEEDGEVGTQHFQYYLNAEKATLLQKEFMPVVGDEKPETEIETVEFPLNKEELYLIQKAQEYNLPEEDIGYACFATAQLKDDRLSAEYREDCQDWYHTAMTGLQEKIAQNRYESIKEVGKGAKPTLFGGNNLSEEEAMQKARKTLDGLQKRRMTEYFEQNPFEHTPYSRVEFADHNEFYYGVPVLENNKLKGFNMMTFSKEYDPIIGAGVKSEERPMLDKNGKPLFLTVEEYMKFEKDMSKQDTRIGNLIGLAKEQKEINRLFNKFKGNSEENAFMKFFKSIKSKLTVKD